MTHTIHESSDAQVQQFEESGFTLFPDVFSEKTLSEICQHLESAPGTGAPHASVGQVYAIRDVFAQYPLMLELAAAAPLHDIPALLSGGQTRPTKATYFDKRPEANWTLPLHQDLTITLANHADIPGYTHWSVKAGAPHVQPPVSILESIVALRIHLDDCPVENGALEVVPGSHRYGRIGAPALREMSQSGAAVSCPAQKGDVLAMRPLLVHGSRKALAPVRRRVLHLEYCATRLAEPLRWPEWGPAVLEQGPSRPS